MANEIEETLDTPEETEAEQTETPTEEEEQVEETPEEDPTVDLNKKIKTLEAQKEHWRKKATERPQVEEEAVRTAKTSGLSDNDLLYLAKADIHPDDIPDVRNYAERMGVSVSDAHKYLKPVLVERQEERKTAQATTVKGSARGANKNTGEELLRKAERTGEVPTSAADIQALAQARIDRAKRKS